MSLEHAILGFLAQRERSGYDLKTRCFDVDVRAFWTADQAQIYRTLERLQTKGFVVARRKRQSGRPDRKLYSITDPGRTELLRWLASPEPLPSPRDAYRLRIYFAAKLSDEDLLGVLRTRRDRHQERLDALRLEASHAARAEVGSGREGSLRSMARDGAIFEQRAAVDWLDDCIDAVEGGSLPPIPLDAALSPGGA